MTQTAVLDRVVAGKGDRIIPEQTPKHSSASNPAEAAVKQIEGQAHVLTLDLEMRHGTRVTANDVLWTWVCNHADQLLTRCGRKAGGRRRAIWVGNSEEYKEHLLLTDKELDRARSVWRLAKKDERM